MDSQPWDPPPGHNPPASETIHSDEQKTHTDVEGPTVTYFESRFFKKLFHQDCQVPDV